MENIGYLLVFFSGLILGIGFSESRFFYRRRCKTCGKVCKSLRGLKIHTKLHEERRRQYAGKEEERKRQVVP